MLNVLNWPLVKFELRVADALAVAGATIGVTATIYVVLTGLNTLGLIGS